MKTRVVGGILLAAICSLQAFGQVGIWKNHTSMQDVRSIARDGATVWAATSGGLFAWTEGSETMTKFTSAEGLQSTDLTAVGVDGKGDVWTGTSTGVIHIYSPSSGWWRYIPDIANSNQTNKRINSISVTGDTVLISTNFGLSVFRVSQFQFGDTYTRFGALSGNVRVAVTSAVLFDGKLWATVSNGQTTHRVAYGSLSNPNLLPPEAWTLETVGTATTLPKHLAVFNNKLYVGTSTGLYVLESGVWTPHDSLDGRNIISIAASPTMMAVAEAGNIVSTITPQNVFSRYGTTVPAAVSAVLLNQAGKPIVATSGGGVMEFTTSWVSHFPNGPASNQFTSIAVDPDGNVWGASGISGGGKGFYRYNGSSWKSFNTKNSPLPFNDYYRVSVACNGDVWLGSWKEGILRMPRGAEVVDTANHFGRNRGLAGTPDDTGKVVTGAATCDGRGNTWITVMLPFDNRPLAVRKSDGTWATLPVYVNGSPQDYITERQVTRPLAVDASDNLWIASVVRGNRGVAMLGNRGSTADSVAEIYLNSSNGLPNDNVNSIVVDRDNNIWIGTESGIAIILDPANPTRSGGIASYKPLSGLYINAIAVDPLNQKWIATNEGAILLSRDGIQTLAQYTMENTDGRIISNEIRDVAVDPKTGTVYFATTNGLASLTTTSVQPKTEFEEIVVSPNPYRIPNSLPLTIDGLVENSKVKILTIDGHLVREFQSPGGRIGFWDGKDESGKDVASGVYLIVAYSETQKDKVGKGKVAVLRR